MTAGWDRHCRFHAVGCMTSALQAVLGRLAWDIHSIATIDHTRTLIAWEGAEIAKAVGAMGPEQSAK